MNVLEIDISVISDGDLAVMDTSRKVYALIATSNGLDVLELISETVNLAGVIGFVSSGESREESGLADVQGYCTQQGHSFIPVHSYNLKESGDRQSLEDLDIEILLVLGWQRLIPPWLIDHARYAVIGVHGSAEGITAGRGRSPQNWALLLGKTEFVVSLFRIESGVDSGEVMSTRWIDIDRADDIRSLHCKVSEATSDMLDEVLSKGKFKWGKGEPQEGEARYLPKRRPEDGEIDWRRGAAEVHDFTRALTRPYPGAFSTYASGRIRIWRGSPMRGTRDGIYQPGAVLAGLGEGELLIQTGDGLFLVREFTLEPENAARPAKGTILASADFHEQMQRIVEQHCRHYPAQPLADDILYQAGWNNAK